MHRAERRERALQALATVGLARRADHLPSELSGGEQQRVAVARAVVNDPAIVLADEPTGNLDTVASTAVLEVLQRLHRQGRTVVVITHEHDVASIAGRIVEMRDGRIVADRPQVARSGAAEEGSLATACRRPHGVIRFDSLRIAFGGISANRLRSFLTMLGMMIGVAAVIVLVAVGNGSSAAVESQIENLGTNLLVVSPQPTFSSTGPPRAPRHSPRPTCGRWRTRRTTPTSPPWPRW